MAHRLQNVYAASEATPGTVETPAVTDTLECDSFTYRPMGDPQQRKLIKSNLGGEQPAALGARWVEVDFSLELKEASAPDVAPEWGRILRAAGFSESGIGMGVSVTYAPQGDPNNASGGSPTQYSLTFQGESDIDGNRYRCFGTRVGTLEISHKSGERGMISGKGIGGYSAVADQGVLTVPTSYGTLPFAQTSDFSIGAEGLLVSEWSISIPVEVSRRPYLAAGASNGYHLWPSFVTWTAPPTISCTIEAVDQTDYALFAAWVASTSGAMSVQMDNGGTSYLLITLPSVKWNAPEVVDADMGPQLFRLVGVCGRSSTTPSITIVSH